MRTRGLPVIGVRRNDEIGVTRSSGKFAAPRRRGDIDRSFPTLYWEIVWFKVGSSACLYQSNWNVGRNENYAVRFYVLYSSAGFSTQL